MKKKLLFVIFLLAGKFIIAQYSKGVQLFENGYYQQSIPYFKKELKRKNQDKVIEKLAQAYYKTRNFNEAEQYYQQATQKNNVNSQIILEYGQVLLTLGKINEAEAQFKNYSKINPGDKRGNLLIKACKELSKNNYQQDKEFLLSEVKSINTDYNEFCPVIHPKGIVYCSDKQQNFDYTAGTTFGIVKTNLLLSEKPKNTSDSLQFNLPKIFAAEISKGQYNGPLSFNSDYTFMAFNRVEEKSIGKTKKNTAKIYFAENKGYNWFNITPFPYNSDEYSCLHPALSPDGKTLIFASNMPDSYGEFDLYVSYKNNSEWTKPQNLGNNINTPFNEVFPYISYSGTLYFSSNGHVSMGGLDIYYAEKEDNTWKNPINAGKTLNSPFDDFGIVLNKDEKFGFFTSNRKEGKSDDDIYAINITYKKNAFKGKILLSENINDVAPNIKLILVTPEGNVVQQTTSDKNGFFKFAALPSENNYILKTPEEDSPLDAYKKIYLADENNNIRKKTTTDDKGAFVFYNLPFNQPFNGKIEDDTRIMITGSILYGENPSKPLTNQSIQLLDEKGNIIAKGKTDNYGGFKFAHLDPEKNYMVTIDENDTKLSANTKIIITDNKGKIFRIFTADGKGLFKFDVLASENNTLRLLEEEDTSIRIEFKGKLYSDEASQNPLPNTTITLLDSKGKVIETTQTDAFGNFKFVNLPSDKNYMILINETDVPANIKKIYIANEKGKIVRTLFFENNKYKYELLPDDRNMLTEIYVEDPWIKMKEIKENKTDSITVIENIYYDYGKWNITAQAAQILDKVANIMKENPTIFIELSSHTDSRSSTEFNLELSKKRAKSAVDYIVSKGIDKNRITGIGMGESKLINYCADGVECSEEQHAQNRRTEFKVLNQKAN